MDSWLYGRECKICGTKIPGGRYSSSEGPTGRLTFCDKHTQQEIMDWQCQPAKLKGEKERG